MNRGEPSAGPASVLVVEAEGPPRAGLVALLSEQDWVVQCFTATGREDGAAVAREHGPDITVVEVSAFLSSVVEAIREAHRYTRLVLHSQCPVAAAVLTRQMRAVGYIGPDATSETVVATIRQVACMPPTNGLTPPGSVVSESPLASLNVREQEILKLLSSGATNREIAATLHLGPDSISKYATGIYRKLGVKNRTEAATWFSSRVLRANQCAP